MTTTPTSPSGSNYSMQRAGNGYAVASLILSLVGFCILSFGGILGIILGIMGLQRARVTGTGRTLSMAGIIVGGLSLCVSVGGAIGVRVAMHKAMDAVTAPRATIASYLTDLSQAHVEAAIGETSGISKDDIAAQAAILQPLDAV